MAGVCIHTPPADSTGKGTGKSPRKSAKTRGGDRWEETIYIELIVDGEVVDLNRIPLPADTPIIDERFKENAAK